MENVNYRGSIGEKKNQEFWANLSKVLNDSIELEELATAICYISTFGSRSEWDEHFDSICTALASSGSANSYEGSLGALFVLRQSMGKILDVLENSQNGKVE